MRDGSVVLATGYRLPFDVPESDPQKSEVPLYRRRTWAGLSWSQQRAVLKAARRGEHHPDPVLADAARRWATEVLAPKRVRALDATAVALLALVSETMTGGWLGSMFAERRAAKRILRLDA